MLLVAQCCPGVGLGTRLAIGGLVGFSTGFDTRNSLCEGDLGLVRGLVLFSFGSG